MKKNYKGWITRGLLVSNRFEEKQKVTYCRDLMMLKKITLCLLIDEIAIDL